MFTKADSELSIARNLEKSGMPDAALSTYRDVIRAYPNTPQAKSATERVKVIEKLQKKTY